MTLSAGTGAARHALLFELSLAGCRVSNLGARQFANDERVRVHVPGFGELEARVRGTSDGAVALHYQRPLHTAVLDRLISICRAGEDGEAALVGAG